MRHLLATYLAFGPFATGDEVSLWTACVQGAIQEVLLIPNQLRIMSNGCYCVLSRRLSDLSGDG